MCKSKWTLLKEFGIHEDALNFTSNKALLFDAIKDFLENQNGNWIYKDYSRESSGKQEDIEKMLTLKVD